MEEEAEPSLRADTLPAFREIVDVTTAVCFDESSQKVVTESFGVRG